MIEPEIQESEEVDEELRELRTQPASYDACRSLLSAVFLTAIEDYRIDLEEFKFKRDVDGADWNTRTTGILQEGEEITLILCVLNNIWSALCSLERNKSSVAISCISVINKPNS